MVSVTSDLSTFFASFAVGLLVALLPSAFILSNMGWKWLWSFSANAGLMQFLEFCCRIGMLLVMVSENSESAYCGRVSHSGRVPVLLYRRVL